jgi:hypothetical protein
MIKWVLYFTKIYTIGPIILVTTQTIILTLTGLLIVSGTVYIGALKIDTDYIMHDVIRPMARVG